MKESAIQQAVIAWCHNRKMFKLAFHVDQGGKNSMGAAMKAKRMGRLAGIPDICIPIAGGRTVWLELKAEKGRLSQVQKDMHNMLSERGHVVHTAYGFADAITTLQQIEGCKFDYKE